jgi:photosystem II stability/assembly factor-like uncharacterized protein
MDLTWVSARHGWALAAAPCTRGLCPRVATTGDGGRTWAILPSPPGAGQDENAAVNCARLACVSHIRFATAQIGYLFGPGLFQTTDGGRTWRRLPSHPVEALEPASGTVIRIVDDSTGCPGPCIRVVQEATAGSLSWRTLLRITPIMGGAQSDNAFAQLIRQGASVIYLPIYGNLAAGAGTQHTVIFRSTNGGASWQRLPDPCGGTGQAVHDTAGLATAPGGFLAALCVPRTGNGSTFTLTSTDYGSRWSQSRLVPGATRHYLAQIAAASPGRLAVATGGETGNGPFTYRMEVSTDAGRSWSTAVTGTTQLSLQAPGAVFTGFEDPRTGWWISDARHIWVTRDGGHHWTRQAFP